MVQEAASKRKMVLWRWNAKYVIVREQEDVQEMQLRTTWCENLFSIVCTFLSEQK